MRRLLVVLCALARAGRCSCTDWSRRDRNSDDTWKKCRANDPDVRLSACSRLIDAGTDTPAELASAYYARGNAYRQKSLFALALEDFNAAIEANPALSDAYGDRGITLTILGRFADAIPDFTRVIETYPRLAYALLQPRDLLRAARPRRSRDRGHLAVDRDRAARRISIRAPRHDLFPQESPRQGARRLRGGAGHQPAIRLGAVRPRHHPPAEKAISPAAAPISPPRHTTGRTSPPKWPAPASSDLDSLQCAVILHTSQPEEWHEDAYCRAVEELLLAATVACSQYTSATPAEHVSSGIDLERSK